MCTKTSCTFRQASVSAAATDSVCGRAQVYFAGPDHDREWLEPRCGTAFLVSGAVAKVRPLLNRDAEATRLTDDSKYGFVWVELDREQPTGVCFDEDAKADDRNENLLP